MWCWKVPTCQEETYCWVFERNCSFKTKNQPFRCCYQSQKQPCLCYSHFLPRERFLIYSHSNYYCIRLWRCRLNVLGNHSLARATWSHLKDPNHQRITRGGSKEGNQKGQEEGKEGKESRWSSCYSRSKARRWIRKDCWRVTKDWWTSSSTTIRDPIRRQKS